MGEWDREDRKIQPEIGIEKKPRKVKEAANGKSRKKKTKE